MGGTEVTREREKSFQRVAVATQESRPGESLTPTSASLAVWAFVKKGIVLLFMNDKKESPTGRTSGGIKNM